MKKQTIKIVEIFIATTLISVFSVIFYSSCQKESSAGTIKATQLSKEGTLLSSPIVYTDVNPDSTIVCTIPRGTSGDIQKYYNLDLNNDGKADFVLRTYYQSFSRCSTGGFNSLVSASPASGSGNQIANVNLYAAALDSLTTIDASLSKWSGSTGQKLGEWDRQCSLCDVRYGCWGSPTGNWATGTIKYLGLKLTNGNNIYYGWARLMIAIGPWSRLTVMNYAYNSIPNQPILAGQTK